MENYFRKYIFNVIIDKFDNNKHVHYCGNGNLDKIREINKSRNVKNALLVYVCGKPTSMNSTSMDNIDLDIDRSYDLSSINVTSFMNKLSRLVRENMSTNNPISEAFIIIQHGGEISIINLDEILADILKRFMSIYDELNEIFTSKTKNITVTNVVEYVNP